MIAAWVLLVVGCGSGRQADGDPQPDPPAAAPVVLGLMELSGQTSFLGRTTTKTAILRHDGRQLEILDFAAGGSAATIERSVLSFSSPETVWTVARLGDGSYVLLRSDDVGSSWQVAAEIPFYVESILGLHVDSVTTGVLTAWVAVSGYDFPARSGPFVWTRRLEDDAEWVRVPGISIPPWPYSADARFARSAESAHLLVRGPDVSAFYRLSTDPPEPRPFTPGVPFQVVDWTMIGERSWMAGQVNDTTDDVISSEAAVLSSDDGTSWQVTVLAGLTRESYVGGLDFVDAERGFVCGSNAPSNVDIEAFCFASDDGGASWQRGAIEAPSRNGVSGVVRTSTDTGLALLASGLVSAGVLTTQDGGRSWQNEMLPPLATRVSSGALARSSGAADLAAATRVPSSPAPVARPARSRALQASGPVAWAAGDSAERGVAIAGILLRSDDDGASWQEVLALPGGSFADVDFVDRTTGWVVGGGRILRSDDGGATFADQTANVAGVGGPFLTYALAAADGARAVAGAIDQFAYHLLYTSDGGAHWQPATIEPAPEFPSDRVVDEVCLTTGGAGLLLFTASTELFLTKDGGASWRPVDPRAGAGEFNDNGFVDAPLGCTGAASLSAIIRGVEHGTVALWSSQDGGEAWSSMTALVGGDGGEVPLLASFVGADSAWLAYGDVPGGVTLLGTRDGGATWTDLAIPLAPAGQGFAAELPETLARADDDRAIFLTSRFDGARAAFEHAALTSTDGGTSWARHALPPGFQPLRADYVP